MDDQLWIIIYTHRHGVDAWPEMSKEIPDLEKVAKELDDFEPDREEYLEVRGPWTMCAGSPQHEGHVVDGPHPSEVITGPDTERLGNPPA